MSLGEGLQALFVTEAAGNFYDVVGQRRGTVANPGNCSITSVGDLTGHITTGGTGSGAYYDYDSGDTRLRLQPPFSVAAWVARRGTVPSGAQLIGIGATNNNTDPFACLTAYCNASTQLVVNWNRNALGTYTEVASSYVLPDGVPVLVTLVHTGARVLAYAGLTEIINSTNVAASVLYGTTSQVLHGFYPANVHTNVALAWQGIWSRALTPADVALLAEHPMALFAALDDDDGAGGSAFLRSVADTLGGLDAALRTVTGVRAVTDTAGLTDASTRTTIGVRSVADVTGITDSATRTSAGVRAVADASGLTDATTRTAASTRAVADTVGATDAATRSVTGRRSVADSLGVTDAATTSSLALIARTIADTLGLVDAAGRLATAARVAADAIGLTDAALRTVTGVRAVTDTLGATDTAVSVTAAVRAVSDPLGATDTTTRAVAARRAPNDAVGLVDTVTRTSVVRRVVADLVGLVDQLASSVTSGAVGQWVRARAPRLWTLGRAARTTATGRVPTTTTTAQPTITHATGRSDRHWTQGRA